MATSLPTVMAVSGRGSVDDRNLGWLASLVRARTGITLGPHKHEMIQARLTRRLRQLGLASLAEYRSLLDGPDGSEEMDNLVNALTTNLTRFFREPHHFEHLAETLTGLATTKPPQADGRKRLRLWSAGCSSGEEAYSMAMTVAATLRPLADWDARILATDLDTAMIARARAGLYPRPQAGLVPERYRPLIEAAGPDHFRPLPTVRALVTFKMLNLITGWPMRGPFDAIFCRNVSIYFDRPTQRHLVDRMADLLTPGGHLYLGHSETLLGLSERFQPAGRTVYRTPS